MKDIMLFATIILLIILFIYTNNSLTKAMNLSRTYERKNDNLITSYEKHVEESREIQKTYAKLIGLYDEKSKADDEIIEYQTNKIKSLESKLENLTEKYVDVIN